MLGKTISLSSILSKLTNNQYVNENKKMYIGYIYKVTCLINNKIYIGQTSRTIQYRWEQHIRNSRKKNNLEYKNKFHRALRKYGKDNFKIEELISAVTRTEKQLKESLNFLESYYIQEFDCYKHGYNSSWGGDFNPMWGIRGENHPSSLKINQYSLEGKFIKTWSSLREAGNFYKVAPSNIGRVCNCKNIRNITCKGFIWKYYSDFPNKNDYHLTETDLYYMKKDNHSNSQGFAFLKYKKAGKPILQYNWDGFFLREFKSVAEASRFINGNASTITCVCQGKKSQSRGYIWKYKTNNFPKRIDPYVGKYRKIQETQIKVRTKQILDILTSTK